MILTEVYSSFAFISECRYLHAEYHALLETNMLEDLICCYLLEIEYLHSYSTDWNTVVQFRSVAVTWNSISCTFICNYFTKGDIFMDKSINESEDKDDYISLKMLIILIKMWSPMALNVNRKMRRDLTEKRKFLQQYKYWISEKYAYMWMTVLENYGYKTNDCFQHK